MYNKTNINSTLFKITRIITLIIGIIACITIFGVILGVPLIIASNYYKQLSEMDDNQIMNEADKILIWGIVLAIIMFPLGIIPLIAAFNLNGQLFGYSNSANRGNAPSASMDNKIEKIKKLHELKEQGIIDEEEFKMAKDKILND